MPALSPRVLQSLLAEPQEAAFRLSQEDRGLLAHSLSGYLGGSLNSANAQVFLGGKPLNAFQAHELQHLADVRALFSLSALLAAGAVLVFLLVSLVLLLDKGRPFAARLAGLAGACQSAALGVLGVCALLGLVASLRFEQAFTMLHKALFRNDLWLLDPQRDLLIQLMPQRFFTEYAAHSIKPVLISLGLVLAASTALRAGAVSRVHQQVSDG